MCTHLGEAENIVNEQQHVLVLGVAEVLGDGEASQGDTGTGTGGLVHLTVHQGGLGAIALEVDHTTVNHLVVQIVTLAVGGGGHGGVGERGRGGDEIRSGAEVESAQQALIARPTPQLNRGHPLTGCARRHQRTRSSHRGSGQCC